MMISLSMYRIGIVISWMELLWSISRMGNISMEIGREINPMDLMFLEAEILYLLGSLLGEVQQEDACSFFRNIILHAFWKKDIRNGIL